MTDLVSDALKALDVEISHSDNVLFPDEFKNQIICDKCENVISKLPDRCIDLCITDPPWGINAWTFREKFSEDKIQDDELPDYMKLMEGFPGRLYRVMKSNSAVYVFCGGPKPVVPKNRHQQIHWSPWDMLKRFWKAGFDPQRVIIWDKVSPGRMYRYRTKIEFIIYMRKGQNPTWEGGGEFKDDYIQLPDLEVVHYPKIHGSRKVHIAEKPIRIYEAFIMDSSNPGDLVFDPFAGSGPVIEAAKNTGRDYLAVDIEPENIKKMEKRERQISMFEIMDPGNSEPQTKIEED